MRIGTLSAESSREVQRSLEPSFAGLEKMVRMEVHRATSASFENGGFCAAHIESLAHKVSETILRNNHELSKGHIGELDHSAVRPGVHEMRTRTLSKKLTQQAPKLTISRYTAFRSFYCVFGTLEARYYTSHIPLSIPDNRLFTNTNKTEFSFTLASWLRALVKRGTIISQLTSRYQGFMFNISMPRIVDTEDAIQRPTWEAVESGDIATLRKSLHKRIVFPTDVDKSGRSLLSVSRCTIKPPKVDTL